MSDGDDTGVENDEATPLEDEVAVAKSEGCDVLCLRRPSSWPDRDRLREG